MAASVQKPGNTNCFLDQVDWDAVNKKLRENGLSAIKLQHSADIEHISGNMECLDKDGSRTVRENFLSLLKDVEHRQTLIQDLITKNNQLKEDLGRQTTLTEKYFTQMKDLKIMLESCRARVRELESEDTSRLSPVGEDYVDAESLKINNTRTAMHVKNQQLEHRCLQQTRELDRLKEKMQHLTEQEDKRSQLVGRVFQEFRRRTARAHNSMDDKLLDVIDAYEQQVQTLQRELDLSRTAEEGRSDSGEDAASFYTMSKPPETSANFKSLIKAYERQIKDQNKNIKALEEQNDLVKLDVGARPEVKDYRVAQLRIKKLEKLLCLHNISVPGEKLKTDPYRLKRKFSTKLEDLDYLPLDLCHQYLKDVSLELEVKDLETMVPRLQRMCHQLAEVSRYEQFCRTTNEIVSSLSSGKQKEKRSGSPRKRQHDISSDTLNHLVTVIENWKQDEEGLQELQLSMNRLGERVAPWLKIRLTGEPTIAQITATVDKLVYDDGDGNSVMHEHCSRHVLENVVQHFQTLFDVPSVAGVYPRMNQIFTKLGEVHNVLNTLRNLLGLEKEARSPAIVDSVGRLVSQHNSTTVQQLKTLLQTEDLEGVIRRLEEHTEFFPAFYEVINKLLEILDVRRMDQVIPAVRALKLLAN